MELPWILLMVAGAVILIQGGILAYCCYKRCCKDKSKDKDEPEERKPPEIVERAVSSTADQEVERRPLSPRVERLHVGVKSNPLKEMSGTAKGMTPKVAFPPPRALTPKGEQIKRSHHQSSPSKISADLKSGQLLDATNSPKKSKDPSMSSSGSSSSSDVKTPIRSLLRESYSPEPEILTEPRSFFVVTCSQLDEPEGVCVRLLPTVPLNRLLLHPKLKDIDMEGMALYITNFTSGDGSVSGKKKVNLNDNAETLGIPKSKTYREGIEQLISIESEVNNDEQLSLNLSTEIPDVIVAAQSPSDYGTDKHFCEDSADGIESPASKLHEKSLTNDIKSNNNTTVISIGDPHSNTVAKISTPMLTPAQQPSGGQRVSTPPAAGHHSSQQRQGGYYVRQQHTTSVDFVPMNNSPDYDYDPRDDTRQSFQPDLPLPWCPSEGSCFEVNNENHFTQYRHYCRIVNCPHATDSEHDMYFSHDQSNSRRESAHDRNEYGYGNYSYQSNHSFGRQM